MGDLPQDFGRQERIFCTMPLDAIVFVLYTFDIALPRGAVREPS
jgi:hypothetical protein